MLGIWEECGRAGYIVLKIQKELFSEIDELANEEGMNGTFKEDVLFYQKMTNESAEFKEFCSSLNSFSSAGLPLGSPLWDIMIDLIKDGVWDVVKDFLSVNDFQDIVNNLKQLTPNGVKKIGFRVLRILVKNPAVKAVLSTVKIIETSSKVQKLYKVYEQLEKFNSTILEKLYTTLKNTGGGKILDRIKDTKLASSSLDGHWDIEMGDTGVDDFIRKLANAFGKQWKSGGVSPVGQNNMFAQHLDLSSLGIKYFEYYPFSGSTGWASIDIVLNNGKQFKFRLGRL